jgi:hypothetical protein
MQNAADAAAIAAATGANASTTYAAQAQAVASQLGFANGSGNVTVTASPSAAVVCPTKYANSISGNSYKVTISDNVPLFLSRVVGYAGNTTVNKKGHDRHDRDGLGRELRSLPILHPGTRKRHK